MSKLCNVCGAPMDDNAYVCNNCGTSYAAPAPAPQQPPMAPQYAPQQPPMAPQYAPQQPPMAPQYAPQQPPMAPQYAPQQPPMAPQYGAPQQPPMAPQYGAPGQPPMAPQFGNPAPAPAPKKKTSLKKLGITLGAVAAGIVAIILVISAMFPGPKAMTKKLMKAIEKGDAETIINAMPDFMWEDEDEKQDYIDELQDEFDDMEFENFEYKITNVEDLDDDEIEDFEEGFEFIEMFYDDFNADLVTDYKRVEIDVSYEIDGEEYDDEYEIIYIKYKGQWKVWSGLGF